MSALEMFAAKASTSKPEKSGNKKESIAREGNSEVPVDFALLICVQSVFRSDFCQSHRIVHM